LWHAVLCYATLLLQVDVCDKLQASADDPQEDVSYYPKFEYTLLDGTGIAKFDSTPAKSPTGEVEVSKLTLSNCFLVL
jgi:hypothetical protein